MAPVTTAHLAVVLLGSRLCRSMDCAPLWAWVVLLAVIYYRPSMLCAGEQLVYVVLKGIAGKANESVYGWLANVLWYLTIEYVHTSWAARRERLMRSWWSRRRVPRCTLLATAGTLLHTR